MSTQNDCLSILRAAAPHLDEGQVRGMMGELRARLRQIQASGNIASFDEAAMAAAEDLAGDLLLAHQIEQRNQLRNIIVRAKALNTIREVYAEDPAEGVRALLVGSNQPRRGARLSVDAQNKATMERTFGAFIEELEEQDLLTDFTNNIYAREVAREMWEEGSSGSPKAKAIAKILKKYEDAMVDRQNRAGAWIRKRAGYIVRQSHDMTKIRRSGYQAWRDFVFPRLDLEETFGAMPDNMREEMLRGIYDGLASGVHHRVRGGGSDDFLRGFVGASNLAKKLSSDRVIHFTSADAFMDYHDQFGVGSLSESYIFGMERAIRNSTLMENLGTNPDMMFDSIMKKLLKEHRGDTTKIDKLNANRLRNFYKEVDGTTHVPANVTAAQVGSVFRAIQNMAKLGGATLSAITDVPFAAAELRYQGTGLLGGYINQMKASIGGYSGRKKRRIGRLIGVGLDGMRGDALARFASNDTVPGTVAKLQQKFFKLNLLSWWTDAHKRGVGMMMAADLASDVSRPWSQLSKQRRRLFEMFDISEQEWEMVRGKPLVTEGGERFFTADVVDQLTDDEIKSQLGPRRSTTQTAITRYRDELRTKFQAYFTDRVDYAVPTPGAREFALMRQGTQPGTALGEAIRLFMQFKAFPITVLTRPLARELYGHGAQGLRQSLLGGKGDLVGLAHMLVATTLMGYAAQSAKQISKGREPRDPELPETWLAAAAQGGGFGLYGDFMFGEFNRFGRSFSASIGGPAVSLLDDTAEIYTRFRSGDDASSQAVRMAMNNAPFVNLFYTRLALDYLFLYDIQEQLNPGYLRRLERRLEKQNGQQFIFPPSEFAR